MHVPASVPAKRFCSPRCRVADWHRRNDRRNPASADELLDLSADPNAAPQPPYAANTVPNGVPATGQCPHCGRPIAVVNLLLTPAAAHVTTPTPTTAKLT